MISRLTAGTIQYQASSIICCRRSLDLIENVLLIDWHGTNTSLADPCHPRLSAANPPLILRQNIPHHLHIIRRPDEAFVEAVVVVAEGFGVEAKQMQQRGVKGLDVDWVFGGAE